MSCSKPGITIPGQIVPDTTRAVARAAHDPMHIKPGEESGLFEAGEFVATAVTFPTARTSVEVEIDPTPPDGGRRRYSAVEELGYVLNPMLVAGQTHGGVAQGVGQAMGGADRARSAFRPDATASFMDYQMPRA